MKELTKKELDAVSGGVIWLIKIEVRF
ncbi:bacteriocin [Vibrio penaeicida]